MSKFCMISIYLIYSKYKCIYSDRKEMNFGAVGGSGRNRKEGF